MIQFGRISGISLSPDKLASKICVVISLSTRNHKAYRILTSGLDAGPVIIIIIIYSI